MVSHPNPQEEDIPESIIILLRKYWRISVLVAWGSIPKKIAIFSLSTRTRVAGMAVAGAAVGMVAVVILDLLYWFWGYRQYRLN